MYKPKKRNGFILSMTSAVAMAGLSVTASANPNPYNRADESRISLTGDVMALSTESFTLDYGDGLITIEMDDFDSYDKANLLSLGETVTVRGDVDADFYEARTIEAQTVYSYDTGVYYYANDADEETAEYWVIPNNIMRVPEGTWMGVSGIVQAIDGSEFVMDTGIADVRVETAYLGYDPLDDEGGQQVDIGDKVFISGQVDKNLFDEREIEAASLVTLAPNS